MSRTPTDRRMAQDGYTPLASREPKRLDRLDEGYKPVAVGQPAKPPEVVKGQSTSVQPPPKKGS